MFMEANGPNAPESKESYVSYLNMASDKSGIDICPQTCKSEGDLEVILGRCRAGGMNAKTVQNLRSALHKYARMVIDLLN